MTKEELNEVRHLTDSIKQEQERLIRLKDWIARITLEVDGLPHDHSYPKSSIEELTAQIVDCENKIQRLLFARMEGKARLVAAIDAQIDDNETKEILVERYGFGSKYRDIAKKFHCSENRIFCLHRQGLRKLGIKTNGRAETN